MTEQRMIELDYELSALRAEIRHRHDTRAERALVIALEAMEKAVREIESKHLYFAADLLRDGAALAREVAELDESTNGKVA